MDLGSISSFLAGLGGLWSRAEQYLPLILGIALPLAAVVFTFSMLQSFFQDSPAEDYFRIMGRFGITLAILGDYRSLFDQFNQLSSDLARRFGDPNSFQAFFQQIQSQFTSLGSALAFAANMLTSIVPLLTLLSAVILVLAYLGLVVAQALAVILLYIFGPLLIAMLPNRQLTSVTYTYVKALLQVLLWPAIWSIVFALFTGALLQVFLAGPVVNLVPAILLVLLAILLTQIPRLTGYITRGALNAAGSALSELVTAGLAYVTYRTVETGASAAIAYATGGAAVTVPQAVGYFARSRSAETTGAPPQTNFRALPPPENA
jgi:predicted small integral membrane protein